MTSTEQTTRRRRALPTALLAVAVAAGALAATTVTAAQGAAAGAVEIPLEWRPAIELGDLGPVDLGAIGAIGVEVAPLEDRRPTAALVGERVLGERGRQLQSVTTRDDAAAFATGRLRYLMEEMGVNVVQRGASVVVAGALERFFVREEELYQGEIEVELAIRHAAGGLLWQATVRGEATRFGLPGQVETYQEALSDALFDLAHRFLTLPEVAEALAAVAAEDDPG